MAFAFVLAAVEVEVSSITVGDVAEDVVVVVVPVAVLEDLVVLLQPQRANPARIKVNNIEFFKIGRAHV